MFPGSRYGTEIASITEKLNWMKRRFVILTSALLFGSVPFFTENTAEGAERKDSVTVSTAEMADMLINECMKLRGTRYSYGARGPKAFDCSGFTGYIYNKFGYTLARSSSGQAEDGRPVEGSLSNLQKGDIVVFGARRSSGRIGHVGIFIELDSTGTDFTFIHAAVKGGVTVSHLKEPYYRQRFMGARRILPDFLTKHSTERAEYEFDINRAKLAREDALIVAEGTSRILLLPDGKWVYVNADGTLATPPDSVKIVLEPTGKWQEIKMSNHTIPSLGKKTATVTTKQTSVPAQSAEKVSDNQDDAVYYTIKSGDTLSSIARRNGTSVDKICRLNNITTSTILKIGRRIRIK